MLAAGCVTRWLTVCPSDPALISYIKSNSHGFLVGLLRLLCHAQARSNMTSCERAALHRSSHKDGCGVQHWSGHVQEENESNLECFQRLTRLSGSPLANQSTTTSQCSDNTTIISHDKNPSQDLIGDHIRRSTGPYVMGGCVSVSIADRFLWTWSRKHMATVYNSLHFEAHITTWSVGAEWSEPGFAVLSNCQIPCNSYID